MGQKLMKKSFRYLVLALGVGSFGAVGAAENAATVTQTINEVDHGTSTAAITTPAHTGTLLYDGDYLKTGAKSLAELQLENKTVTRMGANTIFNYNSSNNEVDLQSGTILFSKPKDGQQLNIKTAAVTAAVVGTTGFFQNLHNAVLMGLIEGHSKIYYNGKLYVIHAGEIIVLSPGKPPVIFTFNVPLMVQTSPFFTKFHGHLPNDAYIAAEIAEYENLLHRGFIQPVSGPYTTYTDFGKPPDNNHFDWNNAGNAFFYQNLPPSTETVSTTPTCPPRCCYEERRCCEEEERCCRPSKVE
jgi:FecR-like protein